MLELGQLDAGNCRLFLKLELQNPAGSIKDRIGLSMIEEAERRGALRPGETIIEATAGNTGIGLALVALQKGYRVVLVLPDKMSQEKIFNLRAMGAEVVLTRSDVGKGHPEYYQDLATSLARERGYYHVNQFGNPDNPLAHRRKTGPEILRTDGGELDAVVVGIGSSGTITGLTQFFRERRRRSKSSSRTRRARCSRTRSNRGSYGKAGSWLVEGIGEDFIPEICDFSMCRKALQHSRRRVLRGRARAPAQGRPAGRFFHRHAGRRGAALVPRAVAAEARRDFRLRHRQQVPVEAVQRLLDGGPGLHPASTARRPARPRRPTARRARDGRRGAE